MRGSGVGMVLGLLGIAGLTGCWQAPATVAAPPPEFAVSLMPASATLTSGHAVTFSARIDGGPAGDVAWSVLEPGGGTVDGSGTFRAPAVPGVYTVQAGFRAVPGRTAQAKVTVVAPPAGRITASPRVMPGATGLTAQVPEVPGCTYAWTLSGGELTGGSDTHAVTFQAGSGPKLVLACKVTNAAGDVLDTSLEMTMGAAVFLSISPETVTLTAGRALKFGFSIEGGTSLEVDWSLGEPGAGTLSDTGRYRAPAVPGVYTVRVASRDDPTKTATAKVKVVPMPVDSLIVPDAYNPGVTGLRAMVPDVAGMTYAWAIEGGTISSGADAATLVFQAGNGPTITVRCRITNEAGDFVVTERTIRAFSY